MSTIESAREITPDWLGSVLGAAVSAVRVEDENNGTTGRAGIAVDYAKPSSLPRRFFIKLPPADPAQRDFVISSGMGKREARFYHALSAEMPVRVPQCYFSDWCASGEQYTMVLERLEDSACTFRNASTRYSYDYLRAVLTAFAGFHARYWESPRFQGELEWIDGIRQHEIALQLLPRAMRAHGSRMPPLFTQLCELYMAHSNTLHALWKDGDSTLIHGDVHDGNLFYDTRLDKPGLLDWALLARGPAMRDVAYFLAGTLAPDAQQDEAPLLLEYYRRALLERGIAAPSLAELKKQYAIQAIYPWLGAAVTLAMGDRWQASRYVLRTLERLHLTLEVLQSRQRLQGLL